VEGDQLDAIWLDELRNVDLLKTLRGRMGDRGGLLIVTFTSINENFSAVVNEYERGAITKLEVPAVMLPIKKPKTLVAGAADSPLAGVIAGQAGRDGPATNTISAGNNGVHNLGGITQVDIKDPEEPGSPADSNYPRVSTITHDAQEQVAKSAHDGGDGRPGVPASEEWEIVGYKKVPRLKIAGKGSDGNQRANIVYFHITDNPYYGYEDALRQYQRTGNLVTFGPDRYYKALPRRHRGKDQVPGVRAAGRPGRPAIPEIQRYLARGRARADPAAGHQLP
jgi:hypothetical protein